MILVVAVAFRVTMSYWHNYNVVLITHEAHKASAYKCKLNKRLLGLYYWI